MSKVEKPGILAIFRRPAEDGMSVSMQILDDSEDECLACIFPPRHNTEAGNRERAGPPGTR